MILLLIVGAWLAVLVPMFLRSHDAQTSLKNADRFSDAMRVLSRRGGRDAVVPRRTAPSLVVSETKSPRPVPEAEPLPAPAPLTAAQRRLRLLLVLLGAAVVTALLGLVLPVLLWVHAVIDGLLVAFVVHLRQMARARQARAGWASAELDLHDLGEARAPGRQPVAPQAPAVARPRPRRVAGIPDRMPQRPAPLSVPLPAPAARYEDKALAATGTNDWSPVPVPPPVYVGKATAPAPVHRVLDLTHPGAWSSALEGDEVGLGILDEGPEIDEILTRRRAAGGW